MVSPGAGLSYVIPSLLEVVHAFSQHTVRSGNMPFSHFWPAVVSSLLASVQFELLLPSFLARAHRPKGIDCPVTSEPGR